MIVKNTGSTYRFYARERGRGMLYQNATVRNRDCVLLFDKIDIIGYWASRQFFIESPASENGRLLDTSEGPAEIRSHRFYLSSHESTIGYTYFDDVFSEEHYQIIA